METASEMFASFFDQVWPIALTAGLSILTVGGC